MKKFSPHTAGRFSILLFVEIIFLAGVNAQPVTFSEKSFAKQPVLFTENKGQITNDKNETETHVLYKGSVEGLDAYITDKGVSLVGYQSEENFFEEENLLPHERKKKEHSYRFVRIDLELQNANITASNTEASGLQPTVFNYYLPNCPDGILAVKNYSTITFKNVYPGIDWVWSSDNQKRLKHSFVIHPGAGADNIKLHYRYADAETIGDGKNLLLKTPLGNITEGEVTAACNGKDVDSRIIFDRNENAVSFKTASYDNTHTLIIDPPFALDWANIYGGNFATGFKSVACGTNAIFVTGYSNSTVFPTLNPGGGAYFQGTTAGNYDVALMKIHKNDTILWSTFYGGANADGGQSITATEDGKQVFVTGYTNSSNFPTQNGGGYFNGTNAGNSDAFIAKFNENGVRRFCTYYGGSGYDEGMGICVKGNSLFINGYTGSNNFAVQNLTGAYNQSSVAGTDAFIIKMDTTGTRYWATYYGGSYYDYGTAVRIQDSSVFFTGYTQSSNFPKTVLTGAYNQLLSGGYDAYVLKFNLNGVPVWGTFVGGTNDDYGVGITVGNHSVYVVGRTGSSNFPVFNPGGAAYYDASLSGTEDGFIIRFDSTTLFRTWCTYYGGSGVDALNSVATDRYGNQIFTGLTSSTDFPLKDFGSGAYIDSTLNPPFDALMLAFASNETRIWSTYYGDAESDYGNWVCTDTANIFMVGEGFWGNGGSGNNANGAGGGLIGSVSCFSGFNGNGGLNGNGPFGGFGGAPCTGLQQFGITTLKVACSPAVLGKATVNKNSIGGTPPYNLFWSSGTNADTAYNLPTNFSVVVIDSNGCVASAAGKFPDYLSISAYSQGPPCNYSLEKGFAEAIVNGGTAPYSYLWSDGETTVRANNILQGIYYLTVTDYNGCSATAATDYVSTGSANIHVVSVNCVGRDSAIVTVCAQYSPPWPSNFLTYTQTVGFGVFGTRFTQTGACEYEYTGLFFPGTSEIDFYTEMLVYDPLGSSYQTTCYCGTQVNIGDFSLNVTKTNPSSCGLNNGTISIPAGINYYTCIWSDGHANQFNRTNLAVGTYSVTVNYANNVGCGSFDTTITLNSTFSVATTHTDVTCVPKTGSAIAIPTGGTLPYQYVWSNGIQNDTAVNLNAGTYLVTVTDNGGCSGTGSAIISAAPYPSDSIAISVSVCSGEAYNFMGNTLLQPGFYVDTIFGTVGCDTIVSLKLTLYNKDTTIINKNICVGDSYTFFGQPLQTSGAYTGLLQNMHGCDSVIQLSLIVSPAYQFTVDTTILQGNSFTLPSGIIVSSPGTYKDTLLSSDGCDSIFITHLNVISAIASVPNSINEVHIYPNPAHSEFTIAVSENYIGSVLRVTDAIGRVIIQTPLLRAVNTLDATDIASGVYFVCISNVVRKLVME
jgi:hypothetical protein